MTIRPRALKFRARRAAAAAARAQQPTPAAGTESTDDGFGNRIFPTAAAADPTAAPAGEVQSAAEMAAESEIAAIRSEGLTGRQLRMARRVADRHGIEATSDFDAVRLLRQRGIDPFRHGNMLELVVGEARRKQAEPGAEARAGLPQTVPHGPRLPSVETDPTRSRARELHTVQRDMARRRRRRLAFMFARIWAFVLLPTYLAGYYFYDVATPMYATKSEFVIQQASPQGAGGGVSSLFSGTAMATVQDSVTVQSYLQSREAMLRLDADHGFRAAFTDPDLDVLQRIHPGASNEEVYKVYTRNINISYDPTEGVIRMEVVAPDPALSATFARALISYAEEQVDALTQRLREDQMSGARETYEDAEANVLAAQQKVVALQERRGVMSGDAEVSLLMTQISRFEGELREERLTLQQLLANAQPNQTRVQVARDNIARLEGVIAEIRAEMTKSDTEQESLARVSGELMIAESDLATRQMLLAQALEQMETARIEANRQVRYLSTGVSPVAPDAAAYPRAFENTLVTFLIFSGIYLMLSLTASILREQVSA